MQISFVQEMIPFINSIIRTPNLEIIKYILWRDWFDNYMNISVNLPPYKKKKKLNIMQWSGFESEPNKLSMSPLQLSLEHCGFPSVEV